ncbi:hypothetical protein [Burkholderia lata]|uniref:hypothetical protein n=1 Tax=Burkholderia lata (strain ATCC 17760 / DSM 23089 / LMG 22485 / NCIMB 9086 / R18194 / 383) TaxID=482957 RepID=UPI001584481D|nr:hypothetical protein [Burkholderia lata]
MQDLQQRQLELGEQLQAFEALQQEIAKLQQHAPHDAQIRQRLNRLSRAMRNELDPMNKRLQHCAESLMDKFLTLEVLLRSTGNDAAGQPAAAHNRSPKLLGRAFI